MTFKVGDTVVYPHHGAALIEAVEIRVIKGAEKEYLVLRVAQGDLTVRVPADNVDLAADTQSPAAVWIGARAPWGADAGSGGQVSGAEVRRSLAPPSAVSCTRASRQPPSNTASRNGRLSSSSLAITTPTKGAVGIDSSGDTPSGCFARWAADTSTVV